MLSSISEKEEISPASLYRREWGGVGVEWGSRESREVVRKTRREERVEGSGA